MALQQDIVSLEKGFWTGGSDFYLAHLDDDCLLAFQDMAGVHGREEIAKMTAGNRWKNIKLDQKGFVTPTPDTAILTYEAHGTREDGRVYDALVSTGYVRRGEEWKMAFHQQTPLEPKH